MDSITASVTADDCAATAWDAIVIGAGPAGAYAAIVLSRAGVKTLLVERKAFSRRKVCGGCLNVAAVARLDQLGLRESVCAAGAQPLSGVQLRCGSRRARLDSPGGLALSRETLDAVLVRAAMESGCAFLPETAAQVGPAVPRDATCPAALRPVTLVPRHGVSRVTRAHLVVAADGLSHPSLDGCPEFSAVVSGSARIGIGGLTVRDRLPCPDGVITMAVARGGYVGLVAVENGQTNLAAALDPAFLKERRSPAAAVGDILASAGLPMSAALADIDFQGTPPLTQHSRQLAGHRVVLVGDAAGYVEPFTGEGMAWAFAAASALPPLAQRARQGWDASLQQEWSETYTALIGSEQNWCRALASVIRHPALVSVMVGALDRYPSASRPFFSHIEHHGRQQGVPR